MFSMRKYGWEINKFEQIVVDTTIKLRSKNKRPDAETIFKDIQRNVATNWTIKDVEHNIDLLIASGKLENRPTAKGLDSFFIVKTANTICNVNDDNREVSDKTFSFELVHGTPIPFFVESPEFSNDVNRHFQEDFIYNFNSAIETAEIKLMGNISEWKYDITELKRNTDNKMVREIEFLRAQLTAKSKVIESLLLSQSMLRDELICSYKSGSGKISAEGICDNRSINYCDKSVNTNETPLEKNQFTESNLVNDYIDVDTILKEINDSLTRSNDVLETVSENVDTNFNNILHNNVRCVTANYANSGLYETVECSMDDVIKEFIDECFIKDIIFWWKFGIRQLLQRSQCK